MFAPVEWFIPQQSTQEFVSGCIAHAASPPPPLEDPPLLEPPDEPPLDAPDDPPLLEPPDEPPLDAPDDPPLDDPPLLDVPSPLDPPDDDVDDPPDDDEVDEPPEDEDELPFLPPPVGSVAFEPVPVPVPLPSSGVVVGAGDAAQATRMAARAVIGSARATCLIGGSSVRGGVLFVQPGRAGKRRIAEKRGFARGDASEAAAILLVSAEA